MPEIVKTTEVEVNGYTAIVVETFDYDGKRIWSFRIKNEVLIIDHRDKSFGFSYTKRRAWERIQSITAEIKRRKIEWENRTKK